MSQDEVADRKRGEGVGRLVHLDPWNIWSGEGSQRKGDIRLVLRLREGKKSNGILEKKMADGGRSRRKFGGNNLECDRKSGNESSRVRFLITWWS